MYFSDSIPPEVGNNGDSIIPLLILPPIIIAVVLLRLATRVWIVKRVRWDDWTILLALVSFSKPKANPRRP